jgi:excinuclease ABC subunit A
MYNGKSIADVLDMSVEEACIFFRNIPTIYERLKVLEEVGLGYISLGQSANTLSGGEAQRIKLAKELARKATGKTLYILDEPSTGLHSHDVAVLLKALHSLVDKGNSMIIIEHNLDIIKTADHIIDIGAEGGEAGGNIVCSGTPEEVAQHQPSYTGQYLAKSLKL